MVDRLQAALVIVLGLIAGGVSPAAAARQSSIEQLDAAIQRAVQTGQFEQGLAAANQLEAIVRKRSGDQSMNFAAVRNNQGMFLHNLGRYAEAADKLAQALQIKERQPRTPPNLDSLLRTSELICQDYIILGRPQEAQTIAQRIFGIIADVYGPNDPHEAGPLKSMGQAARELGFYRDAEKSFGQVVVLQELAQPVDAIALSDALDDLGDVYGLEGRFTEAETTLKRGMTVLQQKYGADVDRVPNYAGKWNSLGNLYQDAYRYHDSEAAFRKAIALMRAQPVVNEATLVAFNGNLATTLNGMSRFAEAEAIYKQVLQADERLFGPDHATTEVAINNLANNYQDQERFAEAVALQQRALSICQKFYGADSADAAKLMVNLANAYAGLGRKQDARALYESAKAIFTKVYGADSVQPVQLLGSLADLDRTEGRFAEAQANLLQAYNVIQRTDRKDGASLVPVLRGLAAIDVQNKDYAAAAARLDQALGIAQQAFGPHDRTTLGVLVGLANVASDTGDWRRALDLLRKASADRRPDASGGNRDASIDAGRIEALWNIAQPQPSAADTEEGFVVAQQVNETRTAAALGQMALRLAAGNDAVAALIRQQQDLAAAIPALDKRINAELGKPAGTRDDAQIAKLRAEQTRAQTSYDDVTARITREFPVYNELATPSPMTVAQARALLGKDEALVFFLSLAKRVVVFAVTGETVVWREVSADRPGFDEKIAALRKGLFSTDDNPPPFDLHGAYDLYRMLFGGIEDTIKSKPKLIAVANGALTGLPLHVLLTKAPDDTLSLSERLRQASWLARDRSIMVLPNVSSLRALRLFAHPSRATRSLIGFGNPVFDSKESKPARGKRNLEIGAYKDFYDGASIDFDVLRTRLPALPDTESELRAIGKTVGATDKDLYFGSAANVSNVAAAKLDDYHIVDFATHGLVAGDVGGLSEPALVLSIPAQPTAADDGLLTASRVAGLALDADWAVLSACNTAAGDKPGAEGLSGLARAFFYAGARSLLVSHWPVNSEAAVKLTTGAFAELARTPGLGRAEALRRSMLALIADTSEPSNADPTVWAPFALVGEGDR